MTGDLGYNMLPAKVNDRVLQLKPDLRNVREQDWPVTKQM